MNPKRLDDRLSASPQLTPSDLAEARRQGFRSIIVNRPDGEEPDQPTIDEMRQAAEQAGLGFSAIPISPGKATATDAVMFADALDQLPGPVLAYCRTGTRAATLWAMSEATEQDPGTLIEAAASAGYDLSALRPALVKMHASDKA